MSLNLHHLRIFTSVAEHGGFSRAAEALRLSQPAVSKSVRALERQLDTSLFDRAAQAPRLTAAGTLLFTRARELFAVERSAEEELRTLRGLEGGVLRIGASTTIATYLLSPCLAQFHAAHPGVRIHVTSANTRDVARALLGRRVDVALVEGPIDDRRLEVLPWREDELVIIGHPGHALAHRRRLDIVDLTDEPFIVRERGSGTRRVAEDALADRGVTLQIGLVLGSTEAIKQAVVAGLGLAIVSRSAIADQLALGRVAVLPVRGAPLRRALTELRFAGRSPSAATTAFRSVLRPVAKKVANRRG